jgi:hypothetical protein
MFKLTDKLICEEDAQRLVLCLRPWGDSWKTLQCEKDLYFPYINYEYAHMYYWIEHLQGEAGE